MMNRILAHRGLSGSDLVHRYEASHFIIYKVTPHIAYIRQNGGSDNGTYLVQFVTIKTGKEQKGIGAEVTVSGSAHVLSQPAQYLQPFTQ